MDDMSLFEERFEERLRAFARTGVQSVDSAAVARAAAVGHARTSPSQPTAHRLGDKIHRTLPRAMLSPRRRGSMLKAAFAAVAVAVLVSGTALLMTRADQPSVGDPSVGASPPAVSDPSATPTATPSATPLLWTQASLDEDWPAPVRSEPVGGSILLPGESGGLVYPDPLGDTGSDVHPWVDIRELQVARTFMYIQLAENRPPAVDPTKQWIAYGVVVDTDRDGVPDWRYGIDNMPVDATGVRTHRAWRTDLHTGRTEPAAGPPYGNVGNTYFDTWYPGECQRCAGYDGPRLGFGGDSTGPDDIDATKGLLTPWYAWASVIEDGRVVATDYAPDIGWLDPSIQQRP